MDKELIKSELLQGLLQVDSSFSITEFFADFDAETRKLSITLTAQKDDGEEVKVVKEYA